MDRAAHEHYDFVELVYEYPLSLPLPRKEDYFLLPISVAKHIGLKPAILTSKTEDRLHTVDSSNHVDIIRSENVMLSFARLLKMKPSLVHGHSFGFLPSTFAPFLTRKYILTTHVYKLSYYPSWKVDLVLNLVKRSDAIIVLTKFEASQFSQIVPPSKIFVIPHTVNTDLFRHTTDERTADTLQRFGIESRENIILCVANLHPRKNIETLIRAFSLVKKIYPDSSLIIAGGEPRSILSISGKANANLKYEEKLVSLTIDLRLKDCVHFIGHQNDQNLLALYSASKVFCLPSRVEGQVLAAGEAASCGLPLVLSDLEPLVEIYHDCALFHKPDDYNALAACIMKIFGNAQLANQLGEIGRLRMRDYSYNIIHNKIKVLYETILSN